MTGASAGDDLMRGRRIAGGDAWEAWDFLCSAGPADRRFEERHERVSVSVVTAGTFVYRTDGGTAFLAPGSLLLGDHGRCFECGHEHGTGDRCLSLQFTPDLWEEVAAAEPGGRGRFGIPALPPLSRFLPLTATLEAAREGDGAVLEEAALGLAGAALRLASDAADRQGRLSARDVRRVAEAVRRIETEADEPEASSLSLAALARDAGVTRAHFLRTFRRIVGETPHRYLLRLRMQRAAVRLRASDDRVSAVALEAGFGDLSTFNRRFRAVMGATPTAWRAAGRR